MSGSTASPSRGGPDETAGSKGLSTAASLSPSQVGSIAFAIIVAAVAWALPGSFNWDVRQLMLGAAFGMFFGPALVSIGRRAGASAPAPLLASKTPAPVSSPPAAASRPARVPSAAQELPLSCLPLPAVFAAGLEASHRCFLQNLSDSANMDGMPWQEKKTGPMGKVLTSPMNGSKRLLYKAISLVNVADNFGNADFVEHTMTWQKRLIWDCATIKEGRVQAKFEDSTDLLVYASAPAVGGAVSSREWIDLRQLRIVREEDGGGLTAILLSADPKLLPPSMPAVVAKPGTVAAKSHRGGGIRIRPLGAPSGGKRQWEIITVINIELCGWLPVSIINEATTEGLTMTCKNMARYLEALPRN